MRNAASAAQRTDQRTKVRATQRNHAPAHNTVWPGLWWRRRARTALGHAPAEVTPMVGT
jgi:hypothetical protein